MWALQFVPKMAWHIHVHDVVFWIQVTFQWHLDMLQLLMTSCGQV